MNKKQLEEYIDTLTKIRDGHPWQIFDHNCEWNDSFEDDDPLDYNAYDIRLSDPHRELKAAREAGKIIQILVLGEWTDISKHQAIYWMYPPEEYRVKPEDPYSELKAAQAAGKVIQLFHYGIWNNCVPDWSSPVADYRIKPEPVHLSSEDVPPGSVIKPSDWDNNNYVNYQAVINKGIRMAGYGWGEFCDANGYISWDELATDWQINKSLCLGKWDSKAWEPCTKEV